MLKKTPVERLLAGRGLRRVGLACTILALLGGCAATREPAANEGSQGNWSMFADANPAWYEGPAGQVGPPIFSAAASSAPGQGGRRVWIAVYDDGDVWCREDPLDPHSALLHARLSPEDTAALIGLCSSLLMHAPENVHLTGFVGDPGLSVVIRGASVVRMLGISSDVLVAPRVRRSGSSNWERNTLDAFVWGAYSWILSRLDLADAQATEREPEWRSFREAGVVDSRR